MKNLFMLALALVMTCTFAFAQSPYSKGESVGKEIAKSAIAEDEENFFEYFEAFFEDIMEYASNDDEQGYLSYCDGIEAGVKAVCKANGISESDAEELLAIISEGLEEALGE